MPLLKVSAVFVVVLAAASGIPLSSAVAEEPQSAITWYEHHPDRAWRELYDPTLLSRRLLTQFEFEDYEGGDALAKWLWNLRWAVPISQDVALGLQIEVPLTWADTFGDDDFGFGDMEARAGLAIRLHDRFRFGFAINAKFPTASSSLLGDDRLEVRPLVAIRWEATSRLDLGANLEYTFTPRDEGDDRVSATEIKLPVTLKITDDWSCYSSYNPRWNDVSNSWRHRLEIGVTRVFGPRNSYAFSIGAEIPLKDEALDWKGVVGLAYYFK